MKRAARVGLWFLVAVLAGPTLAACPAAESSPDPDVKAPAPYREGIVRFANRSLRVEPFVAHPPHMDLYTACQARLDKRREAGLEDIPLCYDPEPRVTLTQLRIEHRQGLTGGQAMQVLSALGEGAHFLIERNGSIYQLLDLAYATRRDGELRPDEIRVFSGSREGQERLQAELASHLPRLQVEVVPLGPPAKSPPAGTPGANAAPAGSDAP